MTDRELMQQALEALETNNQAWKQLADSGDAGFWEAEEQPFYELSVKAITALRQALETEREWVGLTDEEIQDLSYLSQKTDASNAAWFDRWGFAKSIQQALKEKNR